MKAVADGYLHRSPEVGIRYTLSLPIASVVLGIKAEEFEHAIAARPLETQHGFHNCLVSVQKALLRAGHDHRVFT